MGSKFLVSLVSLVATLLLAAGIIELNVRWEEHEYQEAMRQKYKGRDLCVKASENPELIYELIPNKCGHNSIGQRDVEHDKVKAKGVFRIGVIGDSVTEGLGVELEESYPRVLEANLRDSGFQVEVLKFAVRGYTTTQELALLDHALKFDLDLIVWSYVLNDPAHPIYHDVNAEMGRYFYKPKLYFVHWLKRKLFFADQRSRSQGCPEEYHAKLHCQYRDQIERNINTISNKAADIPVIMLIHPVFEKDGFEEYELTEIHADIAEYAENAGIHPIDILEDYRLLPNSSLKNIERANEWFDPWHPSANGHRIIAARLANEIDRHYQLNQ